MRSLEVLNGNYEIDEKMTEKYTKDFYIGLTIQWKLPGITAFQMQSCGLFGDCRSQSTQWYEIILMSNLHEAIYN